MFIVHVGCRRRHSIMIVNLVTWDGWGWMGYFRYVAYSQALSQAEEIR
jgi:hypothetical protein